MKVHEALAHAFVQEGVDTVFGLMGDANMAWLNDLHAHGVELVSVRHEGAGLAMADGFARVSGRVGVCTTTSGPGTSQLATTMLVASRARTPLVAFCGDVATGDDREPQYLDQSRFAAAIEAEFVRVATPESAFASVQRAFHLAASRSRPVLLSAPLDVQEGETDLDPDDYVPSARLRDRHPLVPHPDAVAEAAALLVEAQRVVIVAGKGARLSGATEQVERLATATGALIATTLLAKGFAAGDPYAIGIAGLYATRPAIELCQQADVVVGIGAGLNEYTTEHGYLFPDAAYVQIDTEPDMLLGDGRAADVFVHADAAVAADAIASAVEAGRDGPAPTGFRTAEVRELLSHAADDPGEFELDPGTVDPRAATLTLDELLPGSIGLVLGSGHQARFPTMLLTRERPFSVAQHHFGCIGQGLTTGIGASLATGRSPVFTVEGDAGFLMHLAEFETAVRFRVPILVVVMNDEAIGAEYHKSAASGLETALTTMTTPDLGEVGRALGGRGTLARTVDDLAAAVRAFVADPAPTIVDVRISRSVLSIPYRRLWYGEDV